MFCPGRGLRLLPFLFVLVMEVLSRLILKEEMANSLHGISIVWGVPPISQLLFADDLMLFCRANCGEMLKLRHCLTTFAKWSSQMINYHKSYLHFSANMSSAAKANMADLMRLQQANLAGRYLVLPLCIPRSCRQVCKNLQAKVASRVAGWKAKILSQPRRTMLIQAVATSLPSFFMAIFLLPKEVLRSIDTTMKNFLVGF